MFSPKFTNCNSSNCSRIVAELTPLQVCSEEPIKWIPGTHIAWKRQSYIQCWSDTNNLCGWQSIRMSQSNISFSPFSSLNNVCKLLLSKFFSKNSDATRQGRKQDTHMQRYLWKCMFFSIREMVLIPNSCNTKSQAILSFKLLNFSVWLF